MDRRQRKTREAIFSAFTSLLAKHPYHHITVQDIIDKADIGRATFYAHFETKDYLLKALCDDLFGHITATAMGHSQDGYDYDCGLADDSVFLHLLRHLQENDGNILALLSSQNNEIFMPFFKSNLKKLIQIRFAEQGKLNHSGLPEDYLMNHIATSFVETVDWWLRGGMKETPEALSTYFETVMQSLL